MTYEKKIESAKAGLDSYPLMVGWGDEPARLSGLNARLKSTIKLTGENQDAVDWLKFVEKADRRRISLALDKCLQEGEGQLTACRLIVEGKSIGEHLIAIEPFSENDKVLWFVTFIDSSSLGSSSTKSLCSLMAQYQGPLNEDAESESVPGSYAIELTFPPESKARYSLAKIVESSADAIISYTLKGVIDSWNQGAELMYGYSAGEAIGKSLSIIVPDDRWSEIEDILVCLKEGKAVKAFETVRNTRDGSPLHVSIQVAPLRDESGEVIAGFAISRDVTGRRMAEEALLRQAETLARSNAELERFAWMVAHDLKEPIRTMATYAHLVADSIPRQPESELDEMLNFMFDAGKRASDRIQDVLAYSSIGKKRFLLDKIELNDLVETVLKDLDQTITVNKAEIFVSELPEISVNESTMMLLFQNLIANAIKFRGKSRPRIEISAHLDGDDYVFEIKDNGIGIDPEACEKVFDMFQRLHPDRFPGTGIGLAICKKVVTLHDGKIWVERGKKVGSTICFSIPAHSDKVST
ncbi:MAG: PAS domain S-box protein [Candidatus Obscuribacterales bacterium]|nr:PAS domain S-box protein [Candidatus Obscuribacterales bacterium]